LAGLFQERHFKVKSFSSLTCSKSSRFPWKSE